VRAAGISPEIRAIVVLNLLTEEGLPHFHRLLARYLGDEEGPFAEWNDLWTAEEERHGAVIHDYALYTELYDKRAVERLQFQYLCSAFRPKWENAYELLGYTVLQERATQMAHKNTAKLICPSEPVFSGVLERVAADEARHYGFYLRVFKKIVEIDPDRALPALWKVMRAFDMPGSSMPGYEGLARLARRMGVLGAAEYCLAVKEAIENLGIPGLRCLSGEAAKAQEHMLSFADRLAAYAVKRPAACRVQLHFLHGSPIVTV
jgi:acyl-[acyl-carrier-protein] desaturase